MALDRSTVVQLVGDSLLPDARTQWGRLSMRAKQFQGLVTKTWTPPAMEAEYRDFLRKSRSPLLEFAARCIAEGLVVDGYSDLDVWKKVWVDTGLSGMQPAINLDAVTFGYTYLLAFPGDPDGIVSRPLTARTTFSMREDPWDTDPEYVLHAVRRDLARPDKDVWRVFDDECMYTIKGPLTTAAVSVTEHSLGVNPVTMIQTSFDADGFPDSVVEPGIPAYARVVDATFALKMIERYGAFPQKYQAGGEVATDENGNALIRPSADSLLHSDDYDTKFGSFAAADIDKAAAAVDHHMQQLAAILSIPPHYLLGKVVNLSSDALAATETGYSRRTQSLQASMQDGYETHLHKGASLLGLPDADESELHWLDTSVRSLAQVADAVQKLDAVGADRELLFQMVPGWSKQDAQVATRVALVRDKETPAGGAVTAAANSPDESTD